MESWTEMDQTCEGDKSQKVLIQQKKKDVEISSGWPGKSSRTEKIFQN